MHRSLLLIAALMFATLTANAQYALAPRSVLQSSAPATAAPQDSVPGAAAVPPTMQPAPAPMPMPGTTPATAPAPASVAPPPVAPVPVAPAAIAPASVAPVSITPVTPAGGTLPGSATPGGVPVAAPGTLVDRAAANSVAPGSTTPPQFDRANFDVDFGEVASGGQARRTIVLNTSTRGEAEFGLYVPNAPGFTITEVRVMGVGASVGARSATEAPMPRGSGGAPQTMAVRTVAQRVTAPPWRAQFGAAAEVQVDVAYAPTLDMFSNTAGAKMGVLNGAIRNAGGAGTSASIALRANFTGAQLQPIVVAEREPVVIVGEPALVLPVRITSTGQSGPVRARVQHASSGLRASEAVADLVPGQTVTVPLTLRLSWYGAPGNTEEMNRNGLQAGTGPVPLTIEVTGKGVGATTQVALQIVDSLSKHTANCYGSLPAQVSGQITLSYSGAQGYGRCYVNLGRAGSDDPFRKDGAFDWALFLANRKLLERRGWRYPGGNLSSSERTSNALQAGQACGVHLTREEFLRATRGQDVFRLECAEHE